MFQRLQTWWSRARQQPGKSLLIAGALLAVLASGGYYLSRQAWASYHYHAAVKANDQHKLDQAREHLAICLRIWPDDADSHFLAARVARRAEYYKEAADHLNRAEKHKYTKEYLDLERVLTMVQQGDLAPSKERQLRKCIDQNIEPALVLEALSQAYLTAYRLNDAQECLKKLLDLKPDDTLALLRRGMVEEKLELYIDAEADFRRAVELEPGNVQAQLRWAQMLLRVGKLKEALGLFERLRESQPGDGAVGLGLAKCRNHLGKIPESRLLLDELAAQNPTHLAILIERGRVAMQEGDKAGAETWFRKALTLDPYDFDANYSLGQSLQAQGKEKEAAQVQALTKQLEDDIHKIKDLTRHLQNLPNDPALRSEIGQIFIRLGQEQQGVIWLRSALKINPDHEPSRKALADYLAEKEKKKPVTKP